MADCQKNNNSNVGLGLGLGSGGETFAASAVTEHHEELNWGKKYGGMVPKKKPLITKDNARAFFDSADWALCKQGVAGISQESKVAVETLLPKLQRTPHQQLPPRRPTCTSGPGRDNLVG